MSDFLRDLNAKLAAQGTGSGKSPTQQTAAMERHPFAVRAERLQDNPKFRGERSDEDFWGNLGADWKETLDGWGFLAEKLTSDEAGATLKMMAENFVPSVVESYSRWIDAAKGGYLTEAIYKYPGLFLQDVLPVASLGFGTAGGIVSTVGKGAQAAKVASGLNTMVKWADRLEIATDLVGGAAFVGGKKLASKALPVLTRGRIGRVGKENKIQHTMNIEEDLGKAAVMPVEAVKKGYDQFQREFIDANYDLHKFARKAEAVKQGVPAAQAARFTESPLEVATRTLAGLDGMTNDAINKGFRNPLRFTERLGKSEGLKAVLREVGEEGKPLLQDYATAKRALELEAQGKTSGMDIADANKIISNVESMPDPSIRTAHAKWMAFNRERLDMYQKSGMISSELKTQLLKDNPNYVPFFRSDQVKVKLNQNQKKNLGTVADVVVVQLQEGRIEKITANGGNPIKPPKQAIKKLEGSIRAIKHPLENDWVMTGNMMREAQTNLVMKEIRNLADIEGTGVKLVEKPSNVAEYKPKEALDAHLENDSIIKGLDREPNNVFDVNSDLLRPEGLPKNTVAFFEDGQRKFMEFEDPNVAQVFSGLRIKDYDQNVKPWMTKTFELFKLPAKIKRAGITLAPGFSLVTNLLRDTATSAVMTKYGMVPVVGQVQGLGEWLKRSGANADIYDMWTAAGGSNSSIVNIDKPAIKRQLKSFVNDTSTLAKIRDKVMHPLEFLQTVTEFSEAGTRIGEFKQGLKKEIGYRPGRETLNEAISRARKAGVDVERAVKRVAASSRDVSVDFAIRGNSQTVRAFAALTPFFQANMNGLDLIRRRLADPTKNKKLLLTAFGAYTIPSMMMHMQNKKDPEYLDAPDIEKTLFWHVRSPIDGELKRIPKPFEMGLVFGSLPVSIAEEYEGIDPNAMERFYKGFAQSFNPLDIPAVAKLPIDLYANRDFFFGTPIEPRRLEGLPKSERRRSNTSYLADVLSSWTEWGGDAKLSPIQMDKAINDITGTLGRSASQVLTKAVRGKETDVAPGKGSTPIVGRLTANPSGRSQAVTDVFKEASKFSKIERSFQSKKGAEKAKFRKEHALSLRKDRIFKRATRQLIDITKRIRDIRNHPTMLGTEKRKNIDILNNRMASIAKVTLKRAREL
jgi:hypothetical protein